MQNDTLLLRQIHPRFIQNGRVTSQAFRPTPKDKKKLSVYDGDMIDPEAAYRHYTEELKLSSTGVMAVSVEECNEIGLTPQPDPEPFPEHAVIDFSALGESAIKSKGKLLKNKAVARGWLYRDD
jgi:hypothetical protein